MQAKELSMYFAPVVSRREDPEDTYTLRGYSNETDEFFRLTDMIRRSPNLKKVRLFIWFNSGSRSLKVDFSQLAPLEGLLEELNVYVIFSKEPTDSYDYSHLRHSLELELAVLGRLIVGKNDSSSDFVLSSFEDEADAMWRHRRWVLKGGVMESKKTWRLMFKSVREKKKDIYDFLG
ncbi:hypothetical protein K458DRAFT_417573 [Lentithecium fluviatile CBS 122367]|uniref:Uncharacterized protein n=1 Tax=Lentithecium fluviatile CBS 122367 TaxID=1168545 RepID=A0A6G1J397_9PLEO|nr:hypothetical protein K458DRAFT_417573 [Lentithecium fluviatile CBS 122367]